MTRGTLVLSSVFNEQSLEALEQEAIRLLEDINAASVSGAWEPSPVEERHRLIREALVRTPGVLRTFRRSFLAAGRLNFPDSPVPKAYFLQWGSRLPSPLQSLKGAFRLLRMILRLRRHVRFRLPDLNDNLVGSPSVYSVPRSLSDCGRLLIGRPFGLRGSREPEPCHLTEVQIRMYYYRSRICRAFGRALGPILEVGGGYGGLAIELLRHVETPTYFLVELPDALPVAYFYLRASSDYPVQVIYRPEDRVDPSSRIVLLAPWKLSDMNVEIDLLINTMSFQHMDWKNLQFYLAQADRLKAKRMYLVNRNQKRDPTDVIIDDYPIPTRLRIIKDSKWPFGVHRERLYEAGIEGKAS